MQKDLLRGVTAQHIDEQQRKNNKVHAKFRKKGVPPAEIFDFNT